MKTKFEIQGLQPKLWDVLKAAERLKMPNVETLLAPVASIDIDGHAAVTLPLPIGEDQTEYIRIGLLDGYVLQVTGSMEVYCILIHGVVSADSLAHALNDEIKRAEFK